MERRCSCNRLWSPSLWSPSPRLSFWRRYPTPLQSPSLSPSFWRRHQSPWLTPSLQTSMNSLDDVALATADDEIVVEDSSEDGYEDEGESDDAERVASDDVITKVIPLGGTSEEPEE